MSFSIASLVDLLGLLGKHHCSKDTFRERSLFMAGVGTEEKVLCSLKKNFTPPFAKVKFSLPHQRKTVKQGFIYT